MSREPWFRRRPPPRQSKVQPICWQGYALLIGGILFGFAPLLLLPRHGLLAMILFPIWLAIDLALLFTLIARRTED